MGAKITAERRAILGRIKNLTAELKSRQSIALKLAPLHLDVPSPGIQSLHGFIGGKNNVFVDSVRTAFLSPDDFIAQWFQGLYDRVSVDLPACQAKTKEVRGCMGWAVYVATRQSHENPRSSRIHHAVSRTKLLSQP